MSNFIGGEKKKPGYSLIKLLLCSELADTYSKTHTAMFSATDLCMKLCSCQGLNKQHIAETINMLCYRLGVPVSARHCRREMRRLIFKQTTLLNPLWKSHGLHRHISWAIGYSHCIWSNARMCICGQLFKQTNGNGFCYSDDPPSL